MTERRSFWPGRSCTVAATCLLISVLLIAHAFGATKRSRIPSKGTRDVGPRRTVPLIIKRTLPCGVTVIVREDHSSRIAAISLFLRTGALTEPEGKAGLRAFLQELLLRGTSTMSQERMLDAVESRGATLDGDVGDDYLELFATGSGADCSFLLKLLGEVITQPAFRMEEVSSVRDQLIARARRGDDALTSMANMLRAHLFQNQKGEPIGYGLPSGGTAESLRSIQREDLLSFCKAHCVGSNIVVAVAGDVAAPSMAREAATAFGKVPHGKTKAPKLPVTAPAQTGDVSFALVQSPVPQAWVVAGFSAPGVAHQDFPTAQVMATLLGGGIRSRLSSDFREQNLLAYEVGTSVTWRAQQTELLAYAQVDALGIEEAKNRILTQMERLKSEPITGAELERARRKTIGEFILDHQRNRQRAQYLGLFETLGPGYQFDSLYPELVRKVTAQDVHRIARTHFQRRALVVALPEPTGEPEPGTGIGRESIGPLIAGRSTRPVSPLNESMWAKMRYLAAQS